MNHKEISEEGVPGKGNGKCKGPGVGVCLRVEWQGGKCGWSEEGERGEEER